jgi:hypothetical protein
MGIRRSILKSRRGNPMRIPYPQMPSFLMAVLLSPGHASANRPLNLSRHAPAVSQAAPALSKEPSRDIF